MSNDIQFGIRITGDSTAAANAIKSTRDELDKLNSSGSKMASQYTGLTTASEKAAAAAKQQTSELGKLDAQLTSLLSRLDPVYNATMRVDSANELLHNGLKEGLITQTQYESALGQLEHQYGAVAASAEKSAFATAGARRELIVLGHEAVQGNFSRIPGSFMVLAERLGGLGGLISPLAIGITAIGAAVIGGVYAWEKWSYSAHDAAQKALDDFRQFEDEFDKANKKLEDYQKKLGEMSHMQLSIEIDVKQAELDKLTRLQKSLLNEDGGLKGNLNPFNPMGNKKEYDDLAKQIGNVQKEINSANGAMTNLVENGGKEFKSFMGDTSYMSKAQQKLHDLTVAADDYRKAWMAASDDTQRASALDRFKQAETNINDRYKPKEKKGRNVDRESDATVKSYAEEWGSLNKILDGTKQLSDAEKVLRDVENGRYDSLLPWQREQLANLALDVKTMQDEVEWQKRLSDATDREIEQDNQVAAAEKAINDARDKYASDLAAAQLKEEEDLNVALIKDDTKRAKAQIDLAYQRKIAEIQANTDIGDSQDALLADAQRVHDLQIQEVDSKMYNTKDIGKQLGLTFESAFEKAVTGGQKFSQVLQGLAQDIEKLILRKTVTDPLMQGVGNWIDSLNIGSLISANAAGGVYSGAGIGAYSGQIVSSPTVFPFANGIGLMGEAGPEAIMPLKRGADGKLGVAASDAGSSTQSASGPITVHIDARGADNDAAARIETIAARLPSMIKSGVMNSLVDEKRPGGLLASS